MNRLPAKPPKHVWPRGWPRLFLLVLMFANMVSCYRVRLDHPLLAIGHGAMAVIFLALFAFAGRGKPSSFRQRPEVMEDNEKEPD